MKITSRKAESPKGDITVFRVENSRGGVVELSNLGAGILGVWVPDKDGVIENVALGYEDPASYLYDGPCMGKVPGRYANRIAKGDLVVDGRKYQLAINNGPNALHGGPEGFQNRIWDAEELEDGVRFTYVAADGEENYPGLLKVTAEYRWSEDNALTLKFEAETDAPTVINLTNHAYWNLKGADTGSVLDHEMKVKASNYLPTDETLIPQGIDPVEGTPMDFRGWKAIGKDMKEDFQGLKYGKGYDHCWVLDEWTPGKMIEDAVMLRDPESGRTLAVDTDQPGTQVYAGCWLAGSPLNRSGKSYEDYEGVAIEMQGFPDAPHHPEFPSQLLRPGEKYERTIRFRFGN